MSGAPGDSKASSERYYPSLSPEDYKVTDTEKTVYRKQFKLLRYFLREAITIYEERRKVFFSGAHRTHYVAYAKMKAFKWRAFLANVLLMEIKDSTRELWSTKHPLVSTIIKDIGLFLASISHDKYQFDKGGRSDAFYKEEFEAERKSQSQKEVAIAWAYDYAKMITTDGDVISMASSRLVVGELQTDDMLQTAAILRDQCKNINALLTRLRPFTDVSDKKVTIRLEEEARTIVYGLCVEANRLISAISRSSDDWEECTFFYPRVIALQSLTELVHYFDERLHAKYPAGTRGAQKAYISTLREIAARYFYPEGLETVQRLEKELTVMINSAVMLKRNTSHRYRRVLQEDSAQFSSLLAAFKQRKANILGREEDGIDWEGEKKDILSRRQRFQTLIDDFMERINEVVHIEIEGPVRDARIRFTALLRELLKQLDVDVALPSETYVKTVFSKLPQDDLSLRGLDSTIANAPLAVESKDTPRGNEFKLHQQQSLQSVECLDRLHRACCALLAAYNELHGMSTSILQGTSPNADRVSATLEENKERFSRIDNLLTWVPTDEEIQTVHSQYSIEIKDAYFFPVHELRRKSVELAEAFKNDPSKYVLDVADVIQRWHFREDIFLRYMKNIEKDGECILGSVFTARIGDVGDVETPRVYNIPEQFTAERRVYIDTDLPYKCIRRFSRLSSSIVYRTDMKSMIEICDIDDGDLGTMLQLSTSMMSAAHKGYTSAAVFCADRPISERRIDCKLTPPAAGTTLALDLARAPRFLCISRFLVMWLETAQSATGVETKANDVRVVVWSSQGMSRKVHGFIRYLDALLHDDGRAWTPSAVTAACLEFRPFIRAEAVYKILSGLLQLKRSDFRVGSEEPVALRVESFYDPSQFITVSFEDIKRQEKRLNQAETFFRDSITRKRTHIKHLKLCLACGVVKWSLQRCGQCKTANYCSREHQRQHWPLHKAFCAQYPRAAPGDKKE